MAAAVRQFERSSDRFDPIVARRNAMRFARPRFMRQMARLIDEQWARFREHQPLLEPDDEQAQALLKETLGDVHIRAATPRRPVGAGGP